jgi:hypothetical protein
VSGKALTGGFSEPWLPSPRFGERGARIMLTRARHLLAIVFESPRIGKTNLWGIKRHPAWEKHTEDLPSDRFDHSLYVMGVRPSCYSVLIRTPNAKAGGFLSPSRERLPLRSHAHNSALIFLHNGLQSQFALAAYRQEYYDHRTQTPAWASTNRLFGSPAV